jgi:hypothetical protein
VINNILIDYTLIISQSQKLGFDSYNGSGLAGFSFGTQAANIDLNTTRIKGCIPNPSDVSMEGRDNTDITIKIMKY